MLGCLVGIDVGLDTVGVVEGISVGLVVAREDIAAAARVDMVAAREDLVVAAGGEGVEGNREARPDPVLPVNLVLV